MDGVVTVTYSDGRKVTGELRARDLIEYERKYGKSINDLTQDPHLEWLYFIAFNSMQRAHREGTHDGPIQATFDSFVDRVDDVSIDFEKGTEAPLGGEGSSSG